MVQAIDTERLVDRVSELIGATSKESAARAVVATFKALGEALLADEVRIFSRALPIQLSSALESAPHLGRLSADELSARVTLHEGVELGFAREHAQSVLRALGEVLPEETFTHLERTLAPEVAQLLRAPEIPESEPPPHAPRTARRTLSEGQMKAQHPIAEAAVGSGQLHSVAHEPNPHDDTKLSSSRGLTQEALDESLATGHPSTRPISTGRK
jgi:uncharacterized protein (DUF2267 family)